MKYFGDSSRTRSGTAISGGRWVLLCSCLALFLIAGGCALIAGGCAGPRPRNVPAARIPPAEPAKEALPPGTSSPGATPQEEEAPPLLPGSARVYPSQDPRNHAPAGAPEAFPESSASTAPGTASTDGRAGGKSSAKTSSGKKAGSSHKAASGERAASTEKTGSGTKAGSNEKVSEKARYSVQLFASADGEAARQRMKDLDGTVPGPLRLVHQDGLFKLRSGAAETRAQADRLRRKVVNLGFRGAFVVAFRPEKEEP